MKIKLDQNLKYIYWKLILTILNTSKENTTRLKGKGYIYFRIWERIKADALNLDTTALYRHKTYYADLRHNGIRGLKQQTNPENELLKWQE